MTKSSKIGNLNLCRFFLIDTILKLQKIRESSLKLLQNFSKRQIQLLLQQIATEKVILGSNKKMIRLNVEEMQKNSILDSNFIESLNGIYTIKALCSEKKIVNQIYKSLNDFFDVSLKRNMYDSVTQNLKIRISFLMSAFVLWIGSYDII